MAITASVVLDVVGADFTAVHSTPQFALGTRCKGTYDTTYLYVQASGALAQYATAGIDEAFIAGGVTNTRAATATRPGWPQVAFTDGQYGWVAIGGHKLGAKLKDGVAVDSQLFTSTSVGILGTDSSTGNPWLLEGVRVATAGSGAGNPGEIIAINPHFFRPPATVQS